MHKDGLIALPAPQGRQNRPGPIVFGPDTEAPPVPAPTTLDEVRLLDLRPEDWTERYNTTPVLIETFVETPRHNGAVYRASGWTHVGTTRVAGVTTVKSSTTSPGRTSGSGPCGEIGGARSIAGIYRPVPAWPNLYGQAARVRAELGNETVPMRCRKTTVPGGFRRKVYLSIEKHLVNTVTPRRGKSPRFSLNSRAVCENAALRSRGRVSSDLMRAMSRTSR